MINMQLQAADVEIMEQLAADFAALLTTLRADALRNNEVASCIVIHLRGPLGAGKTCWCRGMLRALGYKGIVKSPTYTLVESYPFDNLALTLHHFDLYRMVDADELEYMGGRDYFDAKAVCVVEWPERAEAVLPPADIEINIAYREPQGRNLVLVAETVFGEKLLALFAGKVNSAN